MSWYYQLGSHHIDRLPIIRIYIYIYTHNYAYIRCIFPDVFPFPFQPNDTCPAPNIFSYLAGCSPHIPKMVGDYPMKSKKNPINSNWIPFLNRVKSPTRSHIPQHPIRYPFTIWLFNMAMENPLKMEVLMGKSSINGPFSMATLVITRW